MRYRHGIDNVEKADYILKDKKNIGLLSNYTGVDSNFNRAVDILCGRYKLAKLYAPEHGYDGVLQAGKSIENLTDKISGLPVLSMFNITDSEEDNIFEGVDAVCFDIQDVGLRFYTYISVLALAMKQCAKRNIPMVVFDRYNPLGLDKVSGTLLSEEFSSFVGMYELPSRHGMTVGEYARYINTEKNINCDLHVIACEGLKRTDNFESLGVPWIQTSPNIPTYETAVVYTGTVVFEDSNVSEGRGTTKPFELIGAPFIDGTELSRLMNDKKIPGVYFREVAFCPTFSKYQGERCEGVQIHVTDREIFEPFYTGLILWDTIRKNYPEFKVKDNAKCLFGSDEIFAPDFDADKFYEKHKIKIAEFTEKTKKYWLYQ